MEGIKPPPLASLPALDPSRRAWGNWRPGKAMGTHQTGHATIVLQKLRQPSPIGMTRGRLTRLVDAGMQCGQVLIVAPPGAGKTTLLGQLATSAGPEIAWYSAGAQEARETDLVQYLAHALWQGTAPIGRGATVDDLLVACGDGSLPPMLLIIDDLHELAGTPAEAALERFLTCRPPDLKVALGSRRPPGFNAPRMLASGTMVELDGDDLRFRSWEVEELFRDIYHEPLTPEAAALLTRRVGGLAAALHLFHLSIQGRSRADREAQVIDLSGRSPLIRSYLTRTVLDNLSPGRRDFLLRTSVLGIMDGPTCDALLDRQGSAMVLRELEQAQLFTTTTDGGQTFRYHQVLRNHLEVTLVDEIPAHELNALYWHAATLLQDAGHHAEALRAYQRAGDWTAASRLIRERAMAQGEDPPPLPQLSLDSAEPDDPWLGLARARHLLCQGSIDAALNLLQRIENGVDDPELARHCVRERLQAGIWRSGAALVSPDSPSPQAAMRALTRRAGTAGSLRDGAGADAPGRHLVSVLSAALSGDLESARSLLRKTLAFPDSERWARLAANMLTVLMDLDEPDGDARCISCLEHISLTAEVEGFPWLARQARGAQAALVLQSTGQLWRLGACEGIIDSCIRDGDRWGEFLLRVCTAVILARLGRIDAAGAQLTSAAENCRVLEAPVLGQWVEAFRTSLHLQRGPVHPSVRESRIHGVCQKLVGPGLEHHSTPPEADSGDPAVTAAPPVVETLGSFRLTIDDQVQNLSPLRPRARTLLMVLALHHGSDIHREQLIDWLWPDVPLEPAIRRLQVAISSIRRLLEQEKSGGGAVRRLGDAYCLELPGAIVDLQTLQHLAARVSARAAARDPEGTALAAADLMALYRGHLLPEVGPAEWVLPERERLRLVTASALATTVATCLETEHPALALGPGQRLVELDPLRDTAWLLLARAQRALGDHTAADATLAEHERVQRELLDLP